MARFDKIISHTLQNEGGFVDHPSDPGGRTKFGITQRTYPELDVENLTKEDAKEIYRRDWWLDVYDEIDDKVLAAKVFDTAINTGKHRAHRILQQAANQLGQELEVDGIFGPLTLEAVNECDPKDLLTAFKQWQLSYYESLIKNNPDLEAFRRGWKNRALSTFEVKEEEVVVEKISSVMKVIASLRILLSLVGPIKDLVEVAEEVFAGKREMGAEKKEMVVEVIELALEKFEDAFGWELSKDTILDFANGLIDILVRVLNWLGVFEHEEKK